jgi:hypothetical protein
MPDGDFLKPFDLNCVEQHLKEVLYKEFGRHLVHARWAHITDTQPIHLEQGRAKCQARNLCMRGCPFGGYFSSVSSTDISSYDNHQPPGLDIHEMGGCRMGKDPKTSLLNEWNQLHHCKNVFVTDGACMTSTGNQSPSILYMALTARAANYAAEQLKKNML